MCNEYTNICLVFVLFCFIFHWYLVFTTFPRKYWVPLVGTTDICWASTHARQIDGLWWPRGKGKVPDLSADNQVDGEMNVQGASVRLGGHIWGATNPDRGWGWGVTKGFQEVVMSDLTLDREVREGMRMALQAGGNSTETSWKPEN